MEDYLQTSYRTDCGYIEGEVLQRNSGRRKHGYAQNDIATWFHERKSTLRLQAITELRIEAGASRIPVPDVVLCEIPIPDEEMFATPPYLCLEVMSPDDTTAAMQERLDDHFRFGVPNIWVVDPWSHCGWRIVANGWVEARSGTMRTTDGSVAMPLADVLLT